MPEGERRWFWPAIWKGVKLVLFILLLLVLIQPLLEPARLEEDRQGLLDRFQQQRGSRVIAMIHRQETVSVFGVPLTRYIDMQDAESVLRAIRQTPPDRPIDLILHTPGGLILPAQQIGYALLGHRAPVTVFVPYYAMSGGTLLALTADTIVMDRNAVLGPVDPQVGGYPAASLVRLLDEKAPEDVSDEMFVLADVAEKARAQMADFLAEALRKHHPPGRADTLSHVFSRGFWTHDFPITVTAAGDLGLPVSTRMPTLIYDLMALYPQGGARRPSVSYVPLRPAVPDAEPRTEW